MLPNYIYHNRKLLLSRNKKQGNMLNFGDRFWCVEWLLSVDGKKNLLHKIILCACKKWRINFIFIFFPSPSVTFAWQTLWVRIFYQFQKNAGVNFVDFFFSCLLSIRVPYHFNSRAMIPSKFPHTSQGLELSMYVL